MKKQEEVKEEVKGKVEETQAGGGLFMGLISLAVAIYLLYVGVSALA